MGVFQNRCMGGLPTSVENPPSIYPPPQSTLHKVAVFKNACYHTKARYKRRKLFSKQDRPLACEKLFLQEFLFVSRCSWLPLALLSCSGQILHSYEKLKPWGPVTVIRYKLMTASDSDMLRTERYQTGRLLKSCQLGAEDTNGYI